MNKIIPYLKKAEALPGYKLAVEFEDGINGIIDLSEWKGKGLFVFWNDEKNFCEFEITSDKKIKWNEDIEKDSDAFYLEIIKKTFSEYASGSSFYGILIKTYFDGNGLFKRN